jgi:tetratricopeptide (TPR) repeat protein
MDEKLGHYRVLEQIGSGGMGVVYLARDERLQRDVAIKVLPPDSLADDDARRRFRREALALSRLNHPNIATIHDFNTFDGVDVLVMEHIPGQGLDELIKRSGPLPEQEIARMGVALATALEAAHDHGIIHRDLKPGNVRMTPDGRLKVLDFGLARALRPEPEATTVTATGSLFAGTLPYMAPEQLTGDELDARTDIYAAGAVLYELATGSRLYPDLPTPRLMGAILEAPVPQPRHLNPRISSELERIITKALEKSPALRYQSARELAIDLTRLEPTSVRRAAEMRPAPRRRTFVIVALVALVAAIVGVFVARYRWTPSSPVPRGSIVIADFSNGTGDPGLADAIRAGLFVQLQQSSYGEVVSRERVFDALRRMQRPPTSLDADTLREVCVREGIPILLAGSIQRRGEVTRVDARALNPASGDVLFNEFVQFRDASETFDNIDALARSVRRRLGEPLSGIQQHNEPLAKVTTRSLKGLEQYSRAAELFARGDPDAALPFLRASLEVDPDFAMAHRLLARVYETLGNGSGEREHLTRAYELRNNLTERERRHVEASYFRGLGQYERAVASLTALTTLYPDDAEGHYDLAIALRDEGDISKAIKELETTIARAPHVTAAYGELVLLLTRSSNYSRAREVLQEAERRSIGGARITWGRGMLLLGEGRVDDARAQFSLLETQGDVFRNLARFYQAVADTYEGRFSRGAERLEQDALLDERDRNTVAELRRRHLLARIALVRGNLPEVRRQLGYVLRAGDENLGAEELRGAAMLLARIGSVREARVIVDKLGSLQQQASSGFARSCRDSAAGELAIAEGQTRRGEELLRIAAAEYPRSDITDGLARALTAAKDWSRARAEWDRLIASPGEAFQEGFAADWVLAHAERARVEQRLGDLQAAERDYATFFRLWARADDVPPKRAAEANARPLESPGSASH